MTSRSDQTALIRDFLVERITDAGLGDDWIVCDPKNNRQAIYFDADDGEFYVLTVMPARVLVSDGGPG